MDADLLYFFSDELEKLSTSPWDTNPGVYANLAGELDDGSGFTVPQLRTYLGKQKGGEGGGWGPFKGRLSGAEKYLMANPTKHKEYVRWAGGK